MDIPKSGTIKIITRSPSAAEAGAGGCKRKRSIDELPDSAKRLLLI